MNSIKVYSFGIALFAATVCFGGKSKKASKKMGFHAYPIQYIDSLPKNYTGINQYALLKAYMRNAKSLYKDEYETKEKYIQRCDSVLSINTVLSGDSLYGFKINEMEIEYNAEKEEYKVGRRKGYGTYSCEPSPNDLDSGWITCPLSVISSKTHDVVMANAFGLAVNVQKSEMELFSIAIKNSKKIRLSLFDSNSEPFFVSKVLKRPIGTAIKNKGKSIASLFIGAPIGTRVITGRSEYNKAKIDNPYELSLTQKSIPIDLRWLIVYVKESGEILERYNLQE